MSCACLVSFPLGVEVFRPDRRSEHHVVVEVDEPLAQAWYPVQMSLNGWRGERGKMRLVGEDFLVRDDPRNESAVVIKRRVGERIT